MSKRKTSPPLPDWRFEETATYEGIAARAGTPYFVYDADALIARADYVRRAFRNTTSVYFAVKANPNLELLKSIQDGVDGLDISSAGELEQALMAGYDAARFSFAGPAKTVEELGRAVECGVGSISLESPRELRDVIAAARSAGTRANVIVRVNPADDPRAFGLKMGGRPLQFGIEEDALESIVKESIRAEQYVNLLGVHVYAGSQGFEFADLAASYRYTLEIAVRVEMLTGRPSRKINLGGGFGISHASASKTLDVNALADEVSEDFRRFIDERGGDTELLFELGRYLVADVGIYVARVVSTKESRGQYFAITDGGLHHHLAAAGNFGAGFRTNYPIVNLTNPDAPRRECSVAGPSCNPTDLLGQKTSIPEPREGDLLAVLSSGSYGLTASPVWFLGRNTPCELVRLGGDMVVGRPSMQITKFN